MNMSRDGYVGPGTVILSDEDRTFIREHKTLIDQYSAVVSALQSALVNRLRGGYGVDIDREDWELDLERGVLRRQAHVGRDMDKEERMDMDMRRMDTDNDTTAD